MWLQLSIFVLTISEFSQSFNTDDLVDFTLDPGEEIRVNVHIPSAANFTTDLTTQWDIIQLRQHIVKLNTLQEDGNVYLKVNKNSTLMLVKSSIIAMCIYHVDDDVIDGVFDLCSGVIGYLGYGKCITYVKPIKYDLSKQVHHVATTKHSVLSDTDDSVRAFLNSFDGAEKSQRHKRGVLKRRYVELYVVADYDYFRLACYSVKAECIRRVFSAMRGVSSLYKRTFNIIMVITFFDIWSDDSNNIWNHIPINKDKANHELVLNWMTNFTTEEKVEMMRVEASLDLVVFLTKAKSGTSLGQAFIGSMCRTKEIYVYVNCVTAYTLAPVLAHKLAHTLGLSHIENNDPCNKCGDASCLMIHSAPPTDRTGAFSECSVKNLTTLLLQPGYECMNNFPEYTAGYQKCGNLVLDPGEECEFIPGDNICCSLECRKLQSAECAWGDCCDIDRCAYKSAGEECTEEKEGVCENVVCSGKSGLCLGGDICEQEWWTDWIEWAPCACVNVSDVQIQIRYCESPQPGRTCPGEPARHRPCKDLPFCMDGQLENWGTWLPCNCSGTHLQKRHKYCTDPSPTNIVCPESQPTQTRPCPENACAGGTLTISTGTRTTEQTRTTRQVPLTSPSLATTQSSRTSRTTKQTHTSRIASPSTSRISVTTGDERFDDRTPVAVKSYPKSLLFVCLGLAAALLTLAMIYGITPRIWSKRSARQLSWLTKSDSKTMRGSSRQTSEYYQSIYNKVNPLRVSPPQYQVSAVGGSKIYKTSLNSKKNGERGPTIYNPNQVERIIFP